MTLSKDINPAKYAAAHAATDLILTQTRVGLGTGSTVNFFLEALAEKYKKENLEIECITTSKATEKRALDLGLPVISFLDVDGVDITIDGTDEVDSQLNLIKGGGGALLREKIVATASTRLVIIADESKQVNLLGAFPLPIEVIPFGWLSTLRMLTGILTEFGHIHEPSQADADANDLPISIRMNDDDTPFQTDEGNFIFDARLNSIEDPLNLSLLLNSLPGVVENGLFVSMADGLIIGKADGTTDVYMSQDEDFLNDGDDNNE